MKVLKGILICTVIGIVIQNLAFLYVEKIYLVSNNSYAIKKIETSSSSKMECNINDKAYDIQVSHDGDFISYIVDGNLKIYDAKNDKENSYKEVSGKLVYYKWLTDCNKIIAIEKIIKSGKQYFVPISYDARSGEGNEITDFDMKEIKIKASDSEKIDMVAFSTVSSSLYIKVKDEAGKSDLYYANQMNDLEKVKSKIVIGNMVVPITSSNVVMENDNKILILNETDSLNIPNVSKPRILGTDKNNKVYFCDDNNGKTNLIYYADVTEKNYRWSRIKLKNEENISDIYIDYSGQTYVNYPKEKKIKELKKDLEISYEGEFLQTYSGGLVSKSGTKIIKKELGK